MFCRKSGFNRTRFFDVDDRLRTLRVMAMESKPKNWRYWQDCIAPGRNSGQCNLAGGRFPQTPTHTLMLTQWNRACREPIPSSIFKRKSVFAKVRSPKVSQDFSRHKGFIPIPSMTNLLVGLRFEAKRFQL